MAGVFSSLIDACGFWAAYTELDEGQGMTTVEMKLNYLAPGSPRPSDRTRTKALKSAEPSAWLKRKSKIRRAVYWLTARSP